MSESDGDKLLTPAQEAGVTKKKQQAHLQTESDREDWSRLGGPYNAALKRHKKKGHSSESMISVREAIDLFRQADRKCSVLRCEFNMTRYEGPKTLKHPWRPSFDQKQPGLGYTRANVRIVVNIFNLARNEWTEEVFNDFTDLLAASGDRVLNRLLHVWSKLRKDQQDAFLAAAANDAPKP